MNIYLEVAEAVKLIRNDVNIEGLNGRGFGSRLPTIYYSPYRRIRVYGTTVHIEEKRTNFLGWSKWHIVTETRDPSIGGRLRHEIGLWENRRIDRSREGLKRAMEDKCV
jgi:hypothetical protein